MLRFGQIVEAHGLLLCGRTLFLPAHPCRRQEVRPQRRGDEDEPERQRGEQREKDICPDRGEHRPHGIDDDAEQYPAARSVREIGLGGMPAGTQIIAVSAAEIFRRRRRMYDEECGGGEQKHAHQPARGNEFFSEGKHGRAVHGEYEQRIDKVSRRPHEERRDAPSDIAEDDLSRDGDQKDDRAEQKQRHPDRLPRQQSPLIFIFVFFSASNAVQNKPPYPLP